MMSDDKDNHVATTSKQIRGRRRNGYFKTKAGEAEEEQELMESLDSRSLNNRSRKKVSKNVNFLNNFP